MKPRKQTKKQRNYIKKRNEIINNFIKKDVGGKPISAGGFGCVFYPALSCKNKKTKKKFVSKMMLKKFLTLTILQKKMVQDWVYQ